AGITLVAVLAQMRQFQRDAFFRGNLASLPDRLVEAFDPAVQMILAVVDGKFVLDAIERESPFGDAVGVASRERPEERVSFQVFIQTVEAEDDVVHLAGAVGGLERNDYAAVSGDSGLDAVRVGQRVNLHDLPVLRLSEIFFLQSRLPLSAETAQKRDGRA